MCSLNEGCGSSSKASKFANSPLGKVICKIGSGTAGVIGALISLGEEEHLTVGKTAKTAFTTAAVSFAGSLLGGTPGFLAGFAVGAVAGYKKLKNSKTLKEVLESMSSEQKEELTKDLINALKNTNIRDLTPDKLPSLISRPDVREIVIKILMNYLSSKMGLKLNGCE